MRIICRISFLDKTTGEEILKSAREEKVYMGTIPLMTTYGTFVINGVERVVVSQLHRSPGLIFDHDKGKTHSSGKLLYASRVIPYRGSWLDFEFDHKDLVYIRIDRRRKLLASILLKALGMANQEILETFYESETYSVTPQGFSLKINSRRLMGRISPVEIKDKDGKDTIVEKGQRITARHIRLIDSNKIKTISLDSEGLNGLITAEDIINKETGELLISCNSAVSYTHLTLPTTKNV